MITEDNSRSIGGISRRKLVATTGVARVLSVAGCLGGGSGGNGNGNGDGNGGNGNGNSSGNDGNGSGNRGNESGGNRNDSSNGSTNGDGNSYQVGYGDSETTVNAADFPTEEQLYVYCVQSGWMNWPSVMEAFQEEYGVELNDNDRSSGECLQDARANAQNPTHSAFNGGYSYALQAMNDDLTQAYKPANWDAVPRTPRPKTVTVWGLAR